MTSDALVDALVRSTFQVAGMLTRIGARHDLSFTQLRVLGILRDRRPRMTELACFLGLDKSTMSGLIDRAERRGLVTRDRNPEDRRVVDVVITPAGRELMEQVYEEICSALEPVTTGLGPERHDRLVELLDAARGFGGPPPDGPDVREPGRASS
ncbi:MULTISPECIES: MarR family winged helix-turn-helix transcriptional regulator [unclassified Streptomyces]|uniref:MarR family winged helix-turn-helix transcriptional regulator n=1 Tax=unclassified Streptomyces TaxID=2593676 RepID=UPI000F6D0032|nr:MULTISPECIES: MarR family transcriptional regulator [unclassified Streptomyces]AZM62180.1 MarR family transcriptional regulator [Streptomyces sp. WAC 01438]RSN00098.1 MarR family transcriptional regulator [Streptomyces sp. WAC 01420]